MIDMTLAALVASAETDCTACEGKGEVYSWEWTEFNDKMTALENRLKAVRHAHGFSVHEPLTTAYGPHDPNVTVPQEIADLEDEERDLLLLMPESSEYQPCDDCDGSGRALTEDGKALMALLWRHGVAAQ